MAAQVKIGLFDPKTISFDDEGAVEYWTGLLDTTEFELRNAVQAVGPRVSEVLDYLSLRNAADRAGT